MREVETKALAFREVVPLGHLIDSETFAYYLLDYPGYAGTSAQFARELDLSLYRDFFQDLYVQSHQVFVHSEQYREDMEEIMLTLPTFGNQRLDDALSKFRNEVLQGVNTKGEGENGMTIFFDPKSGCVGSSEVSFGERSSVASELADVFERKYVPLLEVHTHPNGLMPSPQDYWPLITNGYVNVRASICKAIVVLAPNYQVMALATSETPIFDPTEADSFIEHWDQMFDDKLDPRVQKRSDRATGKARKRIMDYIHRTINQVLVEFAREVGVKLYFSTDMEKFTQFSA